MAMQGTYQKQSRTHLQQLKKTTKHCNICITSSSDIMKPMEDSWAPNHEASKFGCFELPTVGLFTFALGSSSSVLIRKDSADAPIQTWGFFVKKVTDMIYSNMYTKTYRLIRQCTYIQQL